MLDILIATREEEQAVCRALREHGFKVSLVQRGHTAIVRAAQADYDVIIVDAGRFADSLPLAILKQIHSMERPATIFAFTSEDETEKDAARPYCAALLPRPVDPAAVIRLIEVFATDHVHEGVDARAKLLKWRGSPA